MRARYVGLTLVYVLATVLAQGVHDHGEASDATDAHHEAGCNDPRLHLSGHPSSDPTTAPRTAWPASIAPSSTSGSRPASSSNRA